ncbi:MAG: amidohydrolase family protein, partial [Acidobacteriota bacterium]
MAARVIDSHHHLWRYSAEEYGWIDDSMAALRRDFLPADLVAAMQTAGVDGAVAVQARQSVEETRWLLGLARKCDAMLGVVGWAPIADVGLEKTFAEFAGEAKLKGLRHVVQAEAAGFLDGAEFNRGVSALRGTGLVYDVLIFERQLEEAIRFVDRHPQQAFVLDHVAKPKIAEGELEPWRSLMLELGKRTNVSCKVSGMVTEDKWRAWSMESLRPYLEVAAEAFGAERLMAGSDWPVCLVATEYARWWETLREYFAGWSESERAAVFGGNATR